MSETLVESDVSSAAPRHAAVRFPTVTRASLRTLQVNLGYRCNQACQHCHVDAGPTRTEVMDDDTLDLVLDYAIDARVESIDFTGGAPELHPRFFAAVERAHAAGITIIDRCNLTILTEPGMDDLAQQLAGFGVRVIASLPCYSAANVERQRGKGVFDRSITGLRLLNAAGYATHRPELSLDLVYNPQGAKLPPAADGLADDYRRELAALGVYFNNLLTITNMPINRFRHALEREQRYDAYVDLLVDNFDPSNLPHLMCRHLLSVDWQGYVYDCDFNQMLGMGAGGRRRHLRDLAAGELDGAGIAVDTHCFGCAAGRGSSCGGALTG